MRDGQSNLGEDAARDTAFPSLPTPLEYATTAAALPRSRVFTFIASAMLGSLTFGAAWIAFWNLAFEPIVGMVATVVAAIGVVGLTQVARERRRRTTTIVGAISGIITLLAVASVLLF